MLTEVAVPPFSIPRYGLGPLISALLALVFLWPWVARGQLLVDTFFEGTHPPQEATMIAANPSLKWNTQAPNHVVAPPGAGTLWMRIHRHQVPPLPGMALSIPYPSLEVARAHFVHRGQVVATQESGLSIPFQNRPVAHLAPAFLLLTGERWDTLLLELRTRAPLKAPLQFSSFSTLQNQFHTSLAIGALYGGLMLGAAALCYVMGEMTGLGLKLAYTSHILVTCLMALLYVYAPLPLVGIDNPATWIAHAIMAFTPLFCLSLFSTFYFVAKDHIPLLSHRKLQWALIGSFLAISLWSFISLGFYLIIAVHAVGFFTCFSLFWLSFQYKRKIPSAIFYNFVLAQLSVALGLFIFASQSIGPIPTNAWTQSSLYFFTFLEVIFLMNILRKKAAYLNRVRIRALEEREREEKEKKGALAHHTQRMKKLVQLGIALRQEDHVDDAVKRAQEVYQSALSSPLPLALYIDPLSNPGVKEEDLYFATSIHDMLTSTIASIHMNKKMVRQETQRNEEKLQEAQKQLFIVSRLSDRINSPLMSLHGFLGKLLATPVGDTHQEWQRFVTMWLKYKTILMDTLKTLTDISRELSEARDSYGEMETTHLLTKHNKRE